MNDLLIDLLDVQIPVGKFKGFTWNHVLSAQRYSYLRWCLNSLNPKYLSVETRIRLMQEMKYLNQLHWPPIDETTE